MSDSTTASATSPTFPSADPKPTLEHIRISGRPRWSLAHDLAQLFRTSSSASSSTFHSRTRSVSINRDNNVNGCRFDHVKDDEKHADDPVAPVDISPRTFLLSTSPMTSHPPTPSRKTKIYEFLSRSASRSRSKSTRRSSKSSTSASIPPDSDLTTTTVTTAVTDPDTTLDSHLTSTRTEGAKPTTRSPSRPLSSNTSRTASTITPLNAPARVRTPRAFHPHTSSGPPVYPNDMGAGSEYDSTMPPPPVPLSKRKSKPSNLFGISILSRSRPTTPKNERVELVSPPLTPARGRSGWDPRRASKDRTSMEKARVLGPSAPQPIHAPKPRSAPINQSFAAPLETITPVDAALRSRSSPPHAHEGDGQVPTRPPSSLSSRSRGRCSPLFSLSFFTRSRSRGNSTSRSASRKGKNRALDESSAKVSAPALPSRTYSGDGGIPAAVLYTGAGVRSARHGSFDFERIHSNTQPGLAGVGSGGGPQGFRPGPTEIKRSVSSGGAERRMRLLNHGHARMQNQPGPAYSQSTSARAHLRTRHDAVPQNSTPSAHSHSTAATGTGLISAEKRLPGHLPSGEGSWGRRTRTAAWARAGVHPPFSFESAASGSAASAGRASPAGDSDRGKSSLGSRKNERRDNSHPRSEDGQWQEREIDLGLGLAWAPSKIRVREFTGVKDREGSVERERLRREREREREHARLVLEGQKTARREMGFADLRRKEDKEVTARYRTVLGTNGFEAFKKYVRRFDADIIPLDGPSGLLVRVRRLLDAAPGPGLSERDKREMIDDLNRIVLENTC